LNCLSCCSNEIVNEDAEKVLNRTQQNFMSLKKKIYKNVTHEIEKLDKYVPVGSLTFNLHLVRRFLDP